MKERPIMFSGAMVRAILDGRKTQTRRVIKPQPQPSPYGTPIAAVTPVYGDDQRDFRTWLDCTADGKGACEYDYNAQHWCCPYGVPGDLLWVRESWRVGAWDESAIAVDYRADGYSRREWLDPDDGTGDDELYRRIVTQSYNEALKAGIVPDDNGDLRWMPGESPCRWRPSIYMPRWASRITLRVSEVRVQRIQDISEEDALAEGVTPSIVGDDLDYLRYRAGFQTLWDSINAKRGYPWESNPWVWALTFERVTWDGRQWQQWAAVGDQRGQ